MTLLHTSLSLLVRVPVGGDQERVEIYLIADLDDDQTVARGVLTEQFATFNAGKAQCFLASDREHLLAVIEAGFGDFDDFNRVARNLLASRLHYRTITTPRAAASYLERPFEPIELSVKYGGTFTETTLDMDTLTETYSARSVREEV